MLARNKVDMTKDEIYIVKLAIKSVLEYRNKIWIRKDTRDSSEVPMGAGDSAQTTDIVGLYVLSKFKRDIQEIDESLYKNDTLFTIRNL